MHATERFIGCSNLALCVDMYLFIRDTIALNSTGTVEMKPSKRSDKLSCMIHFTSDCVGCTTSMGVAAPVSLVTGCFGKMRFSIILKLSVWFWLLLPSSDIVRRLRRHDFSCWRCKWGMFVSLLICRSHTIISLLSNATRPLSSMMLNTSWKMIRTCDDRITPLPQSTRYVVNLEFRSQYLLMMSSAFSKAMFGSAGLAGWPSGFGARSWFNSTGGFWLAMDRVGCWERTEQILSVKLFWHPWLSIMVSFSVCISCCCLNFFWYPVWIHVGSKSWYFIGFLLGWVGVMQGYHYMNNPCLITWLRSKAFLSCYHPVLVQLC